MKTVSLLIRCLLPVAMLLHFPAKGEVQEGGTFFFSEAVVQKAPGSELLLTLSGSVAPLAGAYLLVQEGERILLRHPIPSGKLERGEIPVPGVPREAAGEYRIILVGHQSAITGLELPLTNAAREVYGFGYFGARERGTFWFQPPAGVQEVRFSTLKGALDVLDENGNRLASVEPERPEQRRPEVAVPLEPGRIYQVDPRRTFYFHTNPGIYLSPNRASYFRPDPRWQERAWWR